MEITLDFDDAFLVFLVLAAHLFTETKKIVGSIKVAVEGQRGYQPSNLLLGADFAKERDLHGMAIQTIQIGLYKDKMHHQD